MASLEIGFIIWIIVLLVLLVATFNIDFPDEEPGCFFAAIPFVVGVSFLLWQYYFAKPSNLWIGIGISFIGLSFIIFVRYLVEIAGYLIGGSIILFGAWYIFLAPMDLAQYHIEGLKMEQPVLSDEDIAISVFVDPEIISSGEKGTLQIIIRNRSEFDIKVKQVEMSLPRNFFDGFLINYQDLSKDIEAKKGIPLIYSPMISFPAFSINAGAEYKLEFPIIANDPDDYSGKYRIVFITSYDSAVLGNLVIYENLHVIVTP